ncbi:MAG: YfhO family protein [Ndongobacter sp.]|nr:YfhO family protein [Ndongobacter sp.]
MNKRIQKAQADRLRPLSARYRSVRHAKWPIIVLSFLLPVLAMTAGFIYSGIWPFGEHTTLAVDLRNEYLGFYEAFRDALRTGDGFFYSVTKSLGGEMAATFAFYLMSPWNLLFFAFPRTALPFIIELTQLIKIGLAGSSFSILLLYSEHGDDWRVVLYSTLYALLSFNTANLLNHVWLDTIILLPLVVLGLERMLRGKNPFLYVLTLSCSIIFNFYIGYMTCIFLCLFVLYDLIRQPRKTCCTRSEWTKHQFFAFLRFACYSLLAGLISAFLLLPTLHSIVMSKGSYASDVVAGWVFDYPPMDFFAKMIPAAFNYDQVPSGLPNVFTGTITTLFCALFFFNKRISLRERLTAFVIVAFLFLSMNIKNLTIFWHGMQYPIWYEYRFSWVFSFFICLLAFRSMRRIPSPKTGIMIVVTLLYGAMLFYLYRHLDQYDFLTPYHIIAAAIVYLLIAVLCLLNPIKRKAAAALLVLISFAEMATNAAFHTGCYSYEPLAEFQLNERELRAVSEGLLPSESGFWRVEKTFMHDNNDGMRFGWPGITHFNSALERETIDLFNALGFATTKNSINGTNPTKFTDAFFGIRYYLVGKKEAIDDQKYVGSRIFNAKSTRPDLADMNEVKDTTFVKVYETPQRMPLGILAESSLPELVSNRANPVDFQDWIANAIDGTPEETNYFRRIRMGEIKLQNVKVVSEKENQTTYAPIDESKSARIHFYFTPEDEASHYLSVSNTLNSKNSKLYLNDVPLDNKRVGSNKNSQVYNVTCNEKNAAQLFTVEFEQNTHELTITNVSLFRLDEQALTQAVRFQEKTGFDIVKKTNTCVEGTVAAATEDTPYLLFTIPYDKGWSAEVDGQPVTPFSALEALLAIPVSPGAHTIKLRYELPYFKLGVLISLIALLITAVLCGGHAILSHRKRKQERQQKAPQILKRSAHEAEIHSTPLSRT